MNDDPRTPTAAMLSRSAVKTICSSTARLGLMGESTATVVYKLESLIDDLDSETQKRFRVYTAELRNALSALKRVNLDLDMEVAPIGVPCLFSNGVSVLPVAGSNPDALAFRLAKTGTREGITVEAYLDGDDLSGGRWHVYVSSGDMIAAQDTLQDALRQTIDWWLEQLAANKFNYLLPRGGMSSLPR